MPIAPKLIRNLVLRSLAAATLGLGVALGSALAQDYPNDTVRIISPWPPGGPADAIGQPLADRLSRALGQPVVLEHQPGANGTIATNYVANAEPDGYTLLLSHAGPQTISPALLEDLPYDPVEDFAHITRVAGGGMLIAVRPDLPIESMEDLLEYARENPGELTYGSVGVGSTVHLAAELLKLEAGVDILHVPYTGFAPNITDFLGGRIDVTVLGIGAMLPHIESGDARPLAVTSAEPSDLLPDVPGMADILPGYDATGWYGLAAPAGTPDEIVQLLASEVDTILQDEELAERIKVGSGMTPITGFTPEEQSQRVADEVEMWQRVVEQAGIEAQ